MKSNCWAIFKKPFPKIFYQILILFTWNGLYGKLCPKKSFFFDFSIKLSPIAIFSHYTMIYISIFQTYLFETYLISKIKNFNLFQKKIFFTNWQNGLFCKAWFLVHCIYKGLDFLKNSWTSIIIKFQTITCQRLFLKLNYFY